MIAFDTNILVYAENPTDRSGKHSFAAHLLTKAGKIDAVIPVQVLGEFVNVCRKKKISDVGTVTAKVDDLSMIFITPIALLQTFRMPRYSLKNIRCNFSIR